MKRLTCTTADCAGILSAPLSDSARTHGNFLHDVIGAVYLVARLDHKGLLLARGSARVDFEGCVGSAHCLEAEGNSAHCLGNLSELFGLREVDELVYVLECELGIGLPNTVFISRAYFQGRITTNSCLKKA